MIVPLGMDVHGIFLLYLYILGRKETSKSLQQRKGTPACVTLCLSYVISMLYLCINYNFTQIIATAWAVGTLCALMILPIYVTLNKASEETN